MIVILLRTEQNGTIEKKEWERNDLAEGPRSKTKRNDLKKVGTCPALSQTRFLVIQTQNNIWCRSGEWYIVGILTIKNHFILFGPVRYCVTAYQCDNKVGWRDTNVIIFNNINTCKRWIIEEKNRNGEKIN